MEVLIATQRGLLVHVLRIMYFEGGFSIYCHSSDEEGILVLPGPLMARGQGNRRPAR